MRKNRGGRRRWIRRAMKFPTRWPVSHHGGATAPEAFNSFFLKKIFISKSSSLRPLYRSVIRFQKTASKQHRSTKKKSNHKRRKLPSSFSLSFGLSTLLWSWNSVQHTCSSILFFGSDLVFVVDFVWESENLKGDMFMENFLVHHVLDDLVFLLCVWSLWIWTFMKLGFLLALCGCQSGEKQSLAVQCNKWQSIYRLSNQGFSDTDQRPKHP